MTLLKTLALVAFVLLFVVLDAALDWFAATFLREPPCKRCRTKESDPDYDGYCVDCWIDRTIWP